MIFGDAPVDVAAVRTRLPGLGVVFAAAPSWLLGAWLAGSYAVGNPSPLSDIDLSVLVAPGTPREDGWHPAGWFDLEFSCRDALGTEEVYLGAWGEFPVGEPVIGPPTALRHSLRRSAPVYLRDPEAAAAFEAAVFTAGRPSMEECQRALWRRRVAGVLGEDRWFLAARRSLSLGHQALRRLGLPVPGRPETIADVLRQAGVVRARDAAWVADAYGQWRRERLWRTRFPLEASIERAWDFAWSVQVALERSCLEGPVSPAASGDDAPTTSATKHAAGGRWWGR